MGAPVLFRQRRAGRHGLSFTLWKLRTMRAVGAGDAGRDASASRPSGACSARSSLDELPQLWNVLRGDMSLVGPRPLLPAYLPRYSPSRRAVTRCRPGITGLTQVSGRNALVWEEKFALDVWYVDHRSLALDLWILWRTLARRAAPRRRAAPPATPPCPSSKDRRRRRDARLPRRNRHAIPMSEPDITDRRARRRARGARTPTLALGPRLDALRARSPRYVGARHGVGVSSGTAGLHLCLLAAGVGEGDVVVTTPFSFVASANCILYVRRAAGLRRRRPGDADHRPRALERAVQAHRRGSGAAR